MNTKIWGILGICIGAMLYTSTPTVAAEHRALAVSVGSTSRAPIGWTDFCIENPGECVQHANAPRDAVITTKTWRELVRINDLVNDRIKPMTDMDHFGVVEKWTYPEDGYGDCEDYVLLKQRLLADAGWPRQALLITVVRDTKGEGHAVLTVKTDRGEFILDNQVADIVLWSESNYRFVKRQAQHDPNVWVSLGDTRPAFATASSR